MRRITFALLVMFAFFGNNAHAQLEVVFSGNPVVQPNGQVSVDVSVNNFENLFGVQFSMNWDSLVLQYNSVTNIVPNSILPDVSTASVGNPSAAGVDPGQATFSWFPFDGSGKTVPDGTVLFTLVFDGVGAPCTSTSILISNNPRVIEVSVDDGNNTDIGAISSGISLEIDCGGGMMDCGPNTGNPACGSGTPGGLGIIGSDELVQSGTNVCMEITVDNFSDIQSAEMNVIWDASLLSYTTTQNYCTDVAGFGASNFFFIGNNLANDTLRFVWFDFNANMPATLPDDKVLFEVCFDAVGPNGSYADVMFLDTEFGDSNQNQVANYTDCGSVEICMPVIDPGMINLYTEDIEVMQGEEICVPVYVDGFTDVQSFQFTMDWVDGVLSYSSIQNINPALDPSPLGAPANGLLPLNWFANTGVTLADGSLLFEVCFDYVGNDCNNNALNNSFISFIDQPNFNIEFGNSNDQLIEPVTTTGAIVTIGCPDCDVRLDTDNPDCIGETGSILVTEGAMPYMGCEWEYNGSPFDPGGCNVFAGLTGNYSVTVTDANNVECILTTSLINPTPISFTPVVTDISCNGDGTVDVPTANISGGTGSYTVSYSPMGPYSMATSVTITVTDSNDCIQTQTVSVANTVTDIAVDNTSATGSCSNDAGEITISLSGGCPPYSTSGGVSNGNTVVISNLMPGDYTQVVTDSRGNMITVGPVNVPTFDTPTGNTVTTPAAFGMSNGTLDLNLMGGLMPYTITINPMGGDLDGDVYSNLPPGDYTITITDDNGCTLVVSETIEELPDLTDTILVDVTILSEAEFNGFGISCNGSCDGAISTVLSGVNGSVVSILVNGQTATLEDLEAGDLCAGTYTVVVEDEEGITGEVTFEITEPEQLVVDMFAVECDSIGTVETGVIDMIVSGGVPDYTYTWSSGQDTEDLSGVAAGTYTLMVEDANGCLDIENVVVVPICEDITELPCYDANNIITPGASAGANDFLLINCAANNPNNLNVYDRWGRLVHTAANYNNTWDGVDMDGSDLGEGTYYWVMDVTFDTGETRLFKGYVTILRDL